jgi:hypothetical protein
MRSWVALGMGVTASLALGAGTAARAAATAAPPVAVDPDGAPAAPELAAAIAAARADLGATAPVTVAAGAFVLVGASGLSAKLLASSHSLATRALEALFNGRFRTRPAHVMTVYLFGGKKPYEAYCKARWDASCTSPFGFYLSGERRLVMNAAPGLGTLTHELVHPIVEADFPGAPTWIDEGLASLFEGPVIPRKGEIHGAKNWRLPSLVAALRSPAARAGARLDRLFGMANDAFRDDDESLHYAMARYFCLWLDRRDLLWPFYQLWRDTAAADPTGALAFRAVTGTTPAEAHAAWERWVLRL